MKRFLIADDHLFIRESISSVLRKEFDAPELVEVTNHVDLINELRQNSKFDLLIVDMHMPGSSPLSSILQISRVWPSLKMLVISGDCNPSLVRGAIKAGASGYYSKVSGGMTISIAIACVLEGSTHMPVEMLDRSASEIENGLVARYGLTQREVDLICFIAEGLSNMDIGTILGLAESSVKMAANSLYKKLGQSNRVHVAKLYHSFVNDLQEETWESRGSKAV